VTVFRGDLYVIRIKMIEVEGPPEEVEKVAHLFGASASPATEVSGGDPASDEKAVEVEVTPKMVLAVLKRRPLLSLSARKMLEVVSKVGPPGLTSAEIAQRMGISSREFAGVHSSFVRRIRNTLGWPKDRYFFDWDRRAEEEGEEIRYWLSDPVAEVLKSGKFPLAESEIKDADNKFNEEE
jgi:hypothetical protein